MFSVMVVKISLVRLAKNKKVEETGRALPVSAGLGRISWQCRLRFWELVL